MTGCFKPLSGIRSSAILALPLVRRSNLAFQTPVGNSFLCNLRQLDTDVWPEHQVSNPCREFVPLQYLERELLETLIPEFQTPVGNSFLCNDFVSPWQG